MSNHLTTLVRPKTGGSIGSINAHYGCDAATKLSATTAERREG